MFLFYICINIDFLIWYCIYILIYKLCIVQMIDFSNRWVIPLKNGSETVYYSRSNYLEFSNTELFEASTHAISNAQKMTRESIRYWLLPSLQKKRLLNHDTFSVHNKNVIEICDWVEDKVMWALRAWISDIFYAVIIHRYLWKSKDEMMAHIRQNMTSGYWTLTHQYPEWLTELNYDKFRAAMNETSEDWKDQISIWKQRKVQGWSEARNLPIPKVTCPFALSASRDDWIKEMWDFIDNRYFPIISVKLQHYKWLYEHLHPDRQALIWLFPK